MKIAGFTIIRNAILNDYPIVEAIASILPVVDLMIVAVGESEDDTLQLIQNIPSEKIKIIKTVWDPNARKGGVVLALETDKAFSHIPEEYDWAFYIQGDEVVHEQYHAAIVKAAERYKDDKRVDGLLFNYLHFYGTFDYIGDSRRWYHKEVRIIRNDKTIQSYKDAQGFRREREKLNVKQIDAFVYHYGWVKSPKQMLAKHLNVKQYWSEDVLGAQKLQEQDFFDFSDFDSLERFTGSHPMVMMPRVASHNWQIDLDVSRKRFSIKGKILYWFEKKTGIRLFDFRNYRII
ncbi:glycosyltransferase family 2 protein [Pseudoflavitalea rhizosphaerae]|uniref:glycosyltransferase family 2 protein n=1 Tax=Pseudoflavitalea rhizosphaerae TaxID=1884793 RepID=UPI000F8F0D16|nr:glycosyltransferase family 2 protein [Pseudoflavitalea rhizosphaerae]